MESYTHYKIATTAIPGAYIEERRTGRVSSYRQNRWKKRKREAKKYVFDKHSCMDEEERATTDKVRER